MNIEVLGNSKVLITVEWREMAQYGVEFGSMSLHDSHTRAMLDDKLHTIEQMGLRQDGERVIIECTKDDCGGCVLMFVLMPHSRTSFVFGCCDDVISAALADALPEKYTLDSQGDTFILTVAEPLSMPQERTLMEFCAD